jgi:hypothetical protein
MLSWFLIAMLITGLIGVAGQPCPDACIKELPTPKAPPIVTPYVERYPSGLLKARVKNG